MPTPLIELLSRVDSITGVSGPKLAKYTWQELDKNLRIFKEWIVELALSSTNLEPYDNSALYSNVLPNYVSYDAGSGEEIWRNVSATPVSGVIPGTNALVWVTASVGEWVHQQNTDRYLSVGTANQVDAVDAHDLIYNQVITISQSTFAIAITAGTLKANRFYFISDAQYPLIIQATGTKHFARSGKYLIRVPYTNNSGNWLSDTDGGAYVINQNLIFGTFVYKNLTGTNTDLTPPNDSTNWQVYARSDSHYTDKWLSTDVTFVSGVFTFEASSFDSKLNNTLTPFQIGGDDYLFRDNHNNNRCNNLAVFDGGIFVGNYIGDLQQCETDTFSGIELAFGNGIIQHVKTEKNGVLTILKRMDGYLSNVFIKDCYLKFEDGIDTGITIQNLNVRGFNVGTVLKGKKDVPIDQINISPLGSNLADSVILSPLADLDLALNGVADLFGEFTIEDNSVTIETVVNYHGLFPVRLKPRVGNSFKINSIGSGGATANNQLLISPGYLVGVLEFDYSFSQELVLVKRFMSNGFDCILINIIPE